MQNWFSIQAEVATTKEDISIIKQNIQFMQSSNPQQIDNNLQVSAKALPFSKDFAGILVAIRDGATSANVTTQDYNFTIGDIVKKQSKQTSPIPQPVIQTENGLTPISLYVVVEGSADKLANFIKEIETRLPLATIKTVEFAEDRAQIGISFYTKDFPKIHINDTATVNILNASDKKIIDTLIGWSEK
jgi:hypothetical protein